MIDDLLKEWFKHVLVIQINLKMDVNGCWYGLCFFRKLVARDQIVTVVITWSRRVKSVDARWNVRCDFRQTWSLLDKNSFFVITKVRNLQVSRKSTIYHIFLKKHCRQLCCDNDILFIVQAMDESPLHVVPSIEFDWLRN